MVQIKRVYETPAGGDGFRILVDRLWPRGVSKDKAAIDLWLKNVAPSPELRQWFDHKPARFAEFSARYELELAANPALNELREIIKREPKVTLVYAAKDPQINHVVVLRDYVGSL